MRLLPRWPSGMRPPYIMVWGHVHYGMRPLYIMWGHCTLCEATVHYGMRPPYIMVWGHVHYGMRPCTLWYEATIHYGMRPPYIMVWGHCTLWYEVMYIMVWGHRTLWYEATVHYGMRPHTLRYEGLPRWLSSKDSACQKRRCRRHWFNLWVGKIPWRRKWQPTPIFLPGKCHGQRSLAGYSPWGCKELDTTKWLGTWGCRPYYIDGPHKNKLHKPYYLHNSEAAKDIFHYPFQWAIYKILQEKDQPGFRTKNVVLSFESLKQI